ncbi:hypothetical protein CFOL_v3_03342, partial [Cephalotus follicularis]
RHGVNANLKQPYRAKTKTRNKIEGNYSESYSYLNKYVDLIRKTNPGPPTFQRVFIFYEASRRTFLQGCRLFIGLDGCHLKDPYGGILLCVIDLDGNQGVLLIAFTVVKVECKES